jgi:hypothetical protein
LQQSPLILYPIEARDVYESRLLVRTARSRLSQRPAINIDTEWQALRLHTVFGDEGTDHFARCRYPTLGTCVNLPAQTASAPHGPAQIDWMI